MLRRSLPPIRRELPPNYTPEWNGSTFQSWARRYIGQNLWRVREKVGDADDALQECAIVFIRCRRRYRFTVDNPRWFMRIFQRAVINRFVVYAKRASQERAFREQLEQQPPDLIDSLAHNHLGPLMHAMRYAKGEVQVIIALLLNSPAETLDSLFRSSDPATINRKVQEHLNLDRPVDVIGELRKLLNQ